MVMFVLFLRWGCIEVDFTASVLETFLLSFCPTAYWPISQYQQGPLGSPFALNLVTEGDSGTSEMQPTYRQ
jgi:hypothetical protein